VNSLHRNSDLNSGTIHNRFLYFFLDVCFEFWSEIFRGYFNMCCEHAWFFSDLFAMFKFEFKPHVTRWHAIGACHLICGDAGAKKKIFFLHQVNEKNTPFFTLRDMRSSSTGGSTVIGSGRRPPPPHLISSTVSHILASIYAVPWRWGSGRHPPPPHLISSTVSQLLDLLLLSIYMPLKWMYL
jgi:hypothetical protein